MMWTVRLLCNVLVVLVLGGSAYAASLIQDVDSYAADAFSNGAKRNDYRPSKRGLDSYRFFGFGLGKRGGDPSATRPGYPVPSTGNYPPSLYETLYQREQLNRAIKALLLATKDDEDEGPAEEMEKRMPEVYEEEFYPMQAGKQQMEVSLDSSLQQNASRDLYPVGTQDIYPGNRPYSPSSPGQPGARPYTPASRHLPQVIVGGSHGEPAVPRTPSKRWWAASRLSSFRTPKSGRAYGRRWGKSSIDPALYFMGLGR